MAELWFRWFEYYGIITMHTEMVIHLMNAYCGVGAKSVAHLMKFYLLQWEVMKVKFLINSNMTFA